MFFSLQGNSYDTLIYVTCLVCPELPKGTLSLLSTFSQRICRRRKAAKTKYKGIDNKRTSITQCHVVKLKLMNSDSS